MNNKKNEYWLITVETNTEKNTLVLACHPVDYIINNNNIKNSMVILMAIPITKEQYDKF